MRSRVIVGVFLLFGVLAAGTLATSGAGVAPTKQWAIVNFINPVRVGTDAIMGQYLIVHDDTKMARGLPCTTFYRFDDKKGPGEAVVSFHCLPKQRKIVEQTTLTIVPPPNLTDLPALTEYQFAGDPEAHGVPRHR
jgi:hypothetical protein